MWLSELDLWDEMRFLWPIAQIVFYPLTILCIYLSVSAPADMGPFQNNQSGLLEGINQNQIIAITSQ